MSTDDTSGTSNGVAGEGDGAKMNVGSGPDEEGSSSEVPGPNGDSCGCFDAQVHAIFPHAPQFSKETSCPSPPAQFFLRMTSLSLVLISPAVADTPCCRGD